MNLKEKLGLLSATTLLAVGAALPAHAQPAQAPAAQEAEDEDVIVVTGSRLRRESFDSPNPTVAVGAEALEQSQTVNVIDAIEEIPLVGIGTNNRGTQVQNGDSFAFPDVLDLGTQRTLTLINGRRVVASNQGTVFVPGNAPGAQVDLSTINPLLIERVDVLAGTGGAIYGADAVAGVVNIITRDDYEGLDIRVQGSQFELVGGDQYRASALWGANLFDDRANITASFDYSTADPVFSELGEGRTYIGPALPSNQLDGTRRRSSVDVSGAIAALTGSACATATACAAPIASFSAFLPSSSDFQTTDLGAPALPFGREFLGPTFLSLGGVLLTNANFSGVNAVSSLVPAGPVGTALSGATADPAGFAFFAPSALTAGQTANPDPVLSSFGVSGAQIASMNLAQRQTLALTLLQANRPTPFEYFAANPTLNPNLFVGTFGTAGATGAATSNGYLPTIASANVIGQFGVTAQLASIFPRLAVPLQFDGAGQLSGFSVGNLVPPYQSLIGATYGAPFDASALGYTQLQAGTERMSFGLQGSYELAPSVRMRTELTYSKLEFEQQQAPQLNGPGQNAQAGSLSVPVFIDQNPFFNTGTNLAQVATLVGQGLTVPVLDVDPSAAVNNQRVLYLGRSLAEFFGGLPSLTETETYRIAQVFEGEFTVGGRELYWDIGAIYGVSETQNNRTDYGDVEFNLAADVVAGPGGQPVCYQQTLASPQPLEARNPQAVNILNAARTAAGLTPTADQVARCVPLNMFGAGRPSQAAIDFITVDASTHSLNRQWGYSGSIGGDLFDLPAGPFALGLNYEFRRESAEFEPNPRLSRGDGRTALQARGAGAAEFTEYGFEVAVPLISEDMNIPLLYSLDFNYAFRIVERTQESQTALFSGSGTEDDTFNYSFTWRPFEDIQIRGARGRTVRSASLTELVGPFTIAFTTPNNTYHPCSTANINAGASVRPANCRNAVRALGIDPDGAGGPLAPFTAASSDADVNAYLATFNANAVVPNIARSAVAQGNPGLANEEGNSYTFGITYEPEWAPRLVLAADFFSVDLTNEIVLTGPFANFDNGSTSAFMGICFDSPTFPNATLSGLNPCEQFLFPQLSGGNFLIPGVNQLTGNTSFAGPLAGTPALAPGALPTTNAFHATMASFNQINFGGRSFRGVNVEARYNFGLEELPLVGGVMEGWGDIFLASSVFHNQRYDRYNDQALSLLSDRFVGEHGTTPEYEGRASVRHVLGPLDHSLQYFYFSGTVDNIRQPKSVYPEQSYTFLNGDFDYFNYLASFDVTDSFTVRLSVNNVLDEDWDRGENGFQNPYDGGFGRQWVLGVQARF